MSVSGRINSWRPQDHYGCCDTAAVLCRCPDYQPGRTRRLSILAHERSCQAFLCDGRGGQNPPYLAYAGKDLRRWRFHIKTLFIPGEHGGGEGELGAEMG